MSTKTLLFEDIPATTTVFNKDTIENYPAKATHKNATGSYQSIKYRKGRYDQTVGNPFGDNYSGTPACPYHMPKNIRRYQDPRLNVPRKNAGDIIEAKDINNLIDKLKLYNYVWEAEANNIYGFAGVNGRANASVDISRLKYIEAFDSNGVSTSQPTLSIHNGQASGEKNIRLFKVPYFYCVRGSSAYEVRTNLINALNTKTKTKTTFGGAYQFGFPENINGYYATDTNSTNKLINAGQENAHTVKFVQNGRNSTTYKLKYINGSRIGQIATDPNGNQLIFKTNIPYITSYMTNNEDLNNTGVTKYSGFILYWVNEYKDLIPEGETITETIITSPVYGIGIYGTPTDSSDSIGYTYDTTKPTYPSGGVTQEVVYDFKQAIKNITIQLDEDGAEIEEYWNLTPKELLMLKYIQDKMVEKDASLLYQHYLSDIRDLLVQKLNKLPSTVLKIPKQKISSGNTCYRMDSNGNWIQQDAIYFVQYVEFCFGWSTTVNLFEESVITDKDSVLYFKVYAYKWNPLTGTAYTATFTTDDKVENIPTGWLLSTAYNPAFINDPIGRMTQISNWIATTPAQPNGFILVKDGLLATAVDVYGSEGDVATNYLYLYQNGKGMKEVNNSFFTSLNSVGQEKYFYTLGESCPNGGDPSTGVCEYTHSYTVNYNDIVRAEDDISITILEKDITYEKDSTYIGESTYPTIKGNDYLVPRNVIKSYLDNLLVLAQIGINNGVSDSTTVIDIQTFYNSQIANSAVFNADDPDSTFLGYHAYQTGIIKLDFYNTLVDAYKVMINSCICNADCACNLVCVCNTNCGCNY